MRVRTLFGVLLAASLLVACMPALVMPSTTQLMLALLKPLVGLDPNVVNLYEQPLIKSRMTALLGQHYDTAMSVLKTADELQREGPLFFVISRYTPIPDLAERVGLVWNAETNQMAAAVVRGAGVEVFTEVVQSKIQSVEQTVIDAALERVTPAWPAPMQAWFEHTTTPPSDSPYEP